MMRVVGGHRVAAACRQPPCPLLPLIWQTDRSGTTIGSVAPGSFPCSRRIRQVYVARILWRQFVGMAKSLRGNTLPLYQNRSPNLNLRLVMIDPPDLPHDPDSTQLPNVRLSHIANAAQPGFATRRSLSGHRPPQAAKFLALPPPADRTNDHHRQRSPVAPPDTGQRHAAQLFDFSDQKFFLIRRICAMS